MFEACILVPGNDFMSGVRLVRCGTDTWLVCSRSVMEESSENARKLQAQNESLKELRYTAQGTVPFGRRVGGMREHTIGAQCCGVSGTSCWP